MLYPFLGLFVTLSSLKPLAGISIVITPAVIQNSSPVIKSVKHVPASNLPSGTETVTDFFST